MTGEDSAAVWTDFLPEAIHNLVAIKLLVPGLLTGDIYLRLFYIITDFVFISN